MQKLILIKKYALNYLSKYDSSKKNLKRILRNKINRLAVDDNEKSYLYKSLNNIVSELEEKKIINDNNYTDNKIFNFSAQGKSRKFILNYLIFKGIEKKLIDERLDKFELYKENCEYESIKKFIKKKKLDLSNLYEKQKNLEKMARAGFSYNIAKKIFEN